VTVVFDAEPLLAFSFDELGAGTVERWLDRVYDGERDGYVSTVNLAEFRYVAAREASAERADAQIESLREMGVATHGVDGLWDVASGVKARYGTSLGDAYAVATARHLDSDEERDVTLLVGADDDDAFDDGEEFEHLIERFRTEPA
jgi:predicted nucleic acid-binding protein